MFAESVKMKGVSCFGDTWTGLEEFKRITVIIGRNNTGKSHFLDIIEKVAGFPGKKDGNFRCSAEMTQEYLEKVFPVNESGNGLGRPGDGISHWHRHGTKYKGRKVTWISGRRGMQKMSFEPEMSQEYDYKKPALERLGKHLLGVGTPISGKKFRRLLADRDIQSEVSSPSLELESDGKGATNIIRRFINSSGLKEQVINYDVRNALNRVFGPDGEFERIVIQEHDQNADVDSATKWEVFLDESRKGMFPLSKSGSGLKTIFLVLLNLIAVPRIERNEASAYVFAFEELENNLHPALLRRLLTFLCEFIEEKKCCLFLTTHSNVALDFFGTRDDSQIIHVEHDGANAHARTIQAHFDHVGLLTELGCRPSDLLQANGVVWLEGPSDRFYFNRFIELFSAGELREGKNYQCAYYGGAVLAKSSFSEPSAADDEFTNLLRLNNNVAVICDGDRITEDGPGSKVKPRVRRIVSEVEKIPGAFLWVSNAKEIENYVPGTVWRDVYGVREVTDPGKFDRFPASGLKEGDFVSDRLGRKSFDKCDFAMKAAPLLTKENLKDRFEFEEKITELVDCIRKWNS